MARGGKKEAKAAAASANPETEERRRLRSLASKNSMLSETPGRVGPSAALSPSKTVLKHHGTDILRKSQRKNRFLFSFPGLLGPVSGGKIGELKNLGTKNPILYLDFPQGQMKLFGTIVYPKNRYLTLQFSRGGKNVMCEDYFDNMVVFSEAWWIGRKEENPEEQRLELPKELNMCEEQKAECDFQGGAGAICVGNKGVSKSGPKCKEPESPEHELKDDSSDSPIHVNVINEVTPTRQSARSAGKSFKFAESSSGDDFIDNGDSSEGELEEVEAECPISTHISTEDICDMVFDNDSKSTPLTAHVKGSLKSTSRAKNVTNNNQGSLVQSTISTLFKKVEEKTPARSVKISQRKAKSVVSPEPGTRKGQASKRPASDLVDPDGSSQLEIDDIEEFSSPSEDIDASDEDWAA